ncbi:MAG: hypothetical protein ACJAXJ_002765 [Colwellia sp.]|jgi:hypothetical protein
MPSLGLMNKALWQDKYFPLSLRALCQLNKRKKNSKSRALARNHKWVSD